MLARSREEQRDIQIIERDLTSDLANQFNQRIDLEGMFLPCLRVSHTMYRYNVEVLFFRHGVVKIQFWGTLGIF